VLYLIGEAPVPGALAPHQWLHPDHCATGRRLLLYSGWTVRELEERTVRWNLLATPVTEEAPWDPAYARGCAWRLIRTIPGGSHVILLGSRVTEAARVFLGPGLAWWLRYQSDRELAHWFATVPHPSGRCRWWNDERNRRAAREFLRAAMELEKGNGNGR
jgi:hypothetical protein